MMAPPKATLRGMDMMQRAANSRMEKRDTPHLTGCLHKGREIGLHRIAGHPHEGGDRRGWRPSRWSLGETEENG
jgi:hypothetical protein